MTFEELASQEWLLTNGIGGFASGTVAGCATRRYHSLLTVALTPPSGHRMALLGGVDDTVILENGEVYPLSTHVHQDGTVYPQGYSYLTSYSQGRWEFTLPGLFAPVIRTLQFYPGKNAIRLEWHGLPKGATLRLAPLVCWKDYHQQMAPWAGFPYRSELIEHGWLVQATPDAPELKLYTPYDTWEPAGWWNEHLWQAREAERGFPATESLYCPATVTLDGNRRAVPYLVASIEPERPTKRPVVPPQDAAKTFIVGDDTTRKTILAGYPWFTDWGRDTFISLPGLCLTTGQEKTAQEIVRDFAPWVRNGRIPNRFPDGNDTPAYNNVDGTLWFIHCIGLCRLAKEFSGLLQTIIEAHRTNTVGDRIYADSDDLLRCGDSHTNLTWMDAKVDGVAITPRYDRPVEVQALWINALKVAGETERAAAAQTAFLEKFVRPDGQGLYDCLLPDGTPDASIRPNQVIAAALLDLPEEVNQVVLQVATEHLLTPYGLRTLSPTDSRFCPRYEGDSHQRDSSYHQGTVWPWLIGSFCDLYKKVHGPDANVAPFLAELKRHYAEDYGLEGIAEIFDGAAPHRPNGCPWQAWSLAEFLRHQ
ncbi:MAG: amylo-alpha-1,6-glucosidase [Armatimonas sp.]